MKFRHIIGTIRRWFIKRPTEPVVTSEPVAMPKVVDEKRSAAAKKAAQTRKRLKTREEALGLVSDLLAVRRYKVNTKRAGVFAGYHKIKPGDISQIEPFILAETTPELYPDVASIRSHAFPTDLIRPMDVSSMGHELKEDEMGNETGEIFDPRTESRAFIQRTRQVTAKDVRGRVSQLMPYMIEQRVVFLDRITNLGEPIVIILGSGDLEEWHSIGFHQRTFIFGQNEERRMHLSFGLAATRQEQWIVTIRRDNNPSMLFPTDPVGVREMFRFRDIPEGKKRRAALVHWVDEHYRRSHNDSSAQSYVRKHLRGKTAFTWNGLHCTVKPPILDAEFSKRPDLVALRDSGNVAPSVPPNLPIPIGPQEEKQLIQEIREGKWEARKRVGKYMIFSPTGTRKQPTPFDAQLPKRRR